MLLLVLLFDPFAFLSKRMTVRSHLLPGNLVLSESVLFVLCSDA